MSGSSTSDGDVTPPYPSPSLRAIERAGERHGTASPTLDDDKGGDASCRTSPRREAGASNYYAGGSSRIYLTNAASPLLPAVGHNSDYMYAMGAGDVNELSNSNSLSSIAFEDSQKRSYHPIEFLMGVGSSAGNLAESLESGRLARHTSVSSPNSAFGMMSAGLASTGQNSFVAAGEPTPSPLFPRPITYGLSPPENPSNETALYPQPSGLRDSFGQTAPSATTAASSKTAKQHDAVGATTLSDSLPSIHGSVFSDVPKQQLPHIRSKNSMASTTTTMDKSPLEPSMTARGATPNRSQAPSLNMSRFPMLQSPNSSVDTHRPTTPTPFSDVLRGVDGTRLLSAFPTQRLPNPPERPSSHLLLDNGLVDSRRSGNEAVAGVRSSVRSTPTAAMLSNTPSPVKTTAYQTPLALLASSSSSSGASTGHSAIPAVAPSPPPSDVSKSISAEIESVAVTNREDKHDEVPAVPVASTLKVEPPKPTTETPNASVQPLPPLPPPPPDTMQSSHPPVSEGDGEGTSLATNGLAGPSAPSSSMSSPASTASSGATRGSGRQSARSTGSASFSSLPSRPPAGPPLLPATSTAANAATGLVRFVPLIQQDDYHKSDVKNVACTAAFTVGDVTATTVKLRLLRHELLGRAEPLPAIQASAIQAGRVRRLKRSTAAEAERHGETNTVNVVAFPSSSSPPPPPPRAVDVGDFHDTLVVFDNVLLAISFALWGSVAHYNELVRGLLAYCATDVSKKKKATDRIETTQASADDTHDKPAAAPQTSAVTKSRLHVPFSSVLRFLNHCGVDVLVIVSSGKAASSFCAKRQQVRRRMRHDAATAGVCNDGTAHGERVAAVTERTADQPKGESGPLSSPTGPDQPQHGRQHTPAATCEPLHRVLVALCYDEKQHMWCPLTTSRPLRQIAAAWHEDRRLARRRRRQMERRQRRHDEAEAAVKAKKAAVEAKLDAWQRRMHAFCQVEIPAAAAAAAAATEAATEQGGRDAESTAATHHVTVAVPHQETTTDEGSSPLAKPGNKLPFDGVLYPNLVQTDVGFSLMLKQALHPLFGVARLRLVVGVPLGFIAVLFGLAFIIYVTKTTAVCFFDSVTQACVVTRGDDGGGGVRSADDVPASSSSGLACIAAQSGDALEGFDGQLSLRFLYGQPVSPGNCLIVIMSCVFAATVDAMLITFFAARYLALGGVRPRFHYVLQAVQFVLGAITCAFAAYVLFCFRARFHRMECDALKAADATLCSTRLSSCGPRYSYQAYTSIRGPHVVLPLAIVYLVLCVLHWLVSLLPVVPSPARQDAIPTATPDTYAFRPSFFAPDGPSPDEIEQLRNVMRAPLRQDLQQCVQQRDRLLTASTTIGEMMLSNRMQSLKQMKLNEERRLRRTRPFARHRGKNTSGRDGARRRHRYLVWSDDELNDAFSHGSDSDDSTRSNASAAAAAARDRKVVLAPRLVQRVDEIGLKVRARTLKQQVASNPFLGAAATPASESMADAGPVQQRDAAILRSSPVFVVNATDDGPHRAASRGTLVSASSFRRASGGVRKVVVADHNAQADSPHSGQDISPAVQPAVHSAPAMPTATFVPLSPRRNAAEATPVAAADTRGPAQAYPSSFHSSTASRPTASALTPKSSFVRPGATETQPKASLQPYLPSQIGKLLPGESRSSMVSPSVEHEIDLIVSRLRGKSQE
jgi:hypothetical protein